MPQRTQIIVVVVLLVLLVGVMIYQFGRKPPAAPAAGAANAGATAPATAKTAPARAAAPGKASPAGKASAAAKTAAAPNGLTTIRRADVNIDELLAGIKEVDFEYERERLSRDPLRPLVGAIANQTAGAEGEAAVAPATVGQILSKTVSAIVWDALRPMAVVDNDVVEPGYEYADGTVVLSIERDRVIFQVGDSPIEVKLKEL